MNTEKFCKEFEKIFGSYKSKCIRKFNRVLSGDKKMISSPYTTFLYKIGLYLNIPVFQVKRSCFPKTGYLFSLCRPAYRRFRKRFRNNCKKTGLATYITGSNLHKCFSKYCCGH